MRTIVRLAVLALALAGPAGAQDSGGAGCSLALAFGLDVSTSVDDHEHRLQRAGLAAALADPAVRDAVLAQPGAVALMAYEWSGMRQQSVVAPWRHVDDAAGLSAFAAALTGPARAHSSYPTALGGAIGFGATMLDAVSWCARLVLDISGDGVSNDGFSPELAYRHFPVEGVTVNGLVIAGADAEVVVYYRDHVIRGPDAFIEIADGFEDYARAMRRKLLRELQTQSLVLR